MTTLDYQSPQTAREHRETPGRWLGWGVFLGMSWTWCIGMFLPVLLLRDYGPWAWVAFAVPNVVGAAAMGWILSARGSELITLHHRPAVSAFSWVTAAFQIFFAFWIFTSIHRPTFIYCTIAVAAASFVAARTDTALALLAACVVLLVSAYVILQEVNGSGSLNYWNIPSPPPRAGLVPLIPVMTFGFALCPYLDSTFHLARRRLPDLSSRHAFLVGFGIFFFVMILFSLAYARVVADRMGGATQFLRLISIHWCAQLGLTIGFHWQFGSSDVTPVWDRAWSRIIASLALGFGAWRCAAWFGDVYTNGGETIYRLFMSFYGLVFPAYVWLCMMPTRGKEKPSRRSLVVLAAVCIVAAPIYWMGFIERRTWWLLPGVGIMLLARVLIPRGATGNGQAVAVAPSATP